MSVISRTRPLDSFQHGLAEGIQILHGANEVWSAANDIVGTLPMYFTSKSTKALKDYKLYGTSEGAGVETENLFNKDATDTLKGYVNNAQLSFLGTISSNNYNSISEYIILEQNADYIIDTSYKFTGTNACFCLYDENYTYITGYSYYELYDTGTTCAFNSGNATYIRMTLRNAHKSAIMLVKDSTAPASYIPPGYKIPLTLTRDGAENLWNGYLEQGTIDTDGVTEVASNNRVRSEYIALMEPGTYTVSINDSTQFHVLADIYNANKTYLDNDGWRNLPYTFTVSSAGYARLIFRRKNDGAITPTDISAARSLASRSNAFDYTTMIDPSSGGYYLAKDGTVTSAGGWQYTTYIPVETNRCTLTPIIGNAPAICFYDATKNCIGGKQYLDDRTIECDLPAGTKYVRFSIYTYEQNPNTIALLTSDTYPLYIGSTKLGAEERVEFSEQKVYKRNPKSFIWTQAFIKKDDADRFDCVFEWSETDRPYLREGFGYLAIRDYQQIITHDTPNVYAKDLTSIVDTDTWAAMSMRDLGTGGNFRTYVVINGEYVYGNSLYITFDEINASPETYSGVPFAERAGNNCIYIDRPPVVLPTDPPAPLPEITAYEGENVLTSTETVGEVTLTGRLAKTYRQVEYLESTGTQYIDTGIVPTYDDAVETYLQFTAPRKYPAKQGVLGTIYDNRRYAIVLGLTEENPLPVCFYCGYPWQSPDTNIQITASVATLTQKQRYYISTTKFQLGTESKTPPSVSQSPPQKTFLLFGMWDNDGVAYPFAGFETMRCFGLTFSVAGVITHNLIPVERNSDGVLGMLDTVTNTFYTNSGTGTFNKGSYVD